MSKAYRLFLFLFLAVTASPRLSAQVERASILGNANDKSGAAVPDVQVTVTHEATNTSVRTVTDQAGAYTVLNLIPGTYTISASRTGFKPVVVRGVELQVSQQARLDLSVEVGAPEQTVEVSAAAPLLDTESAAGYGMAAPGTRQSGVGSLLEGSGDVDAAEDKWIGIGSRI